MSAYRTIDPTARIEQLERENAALREKAKLPPSKPMELWKKLFGSVIVCTLASGAFAQARMEPMTVAFAVLGGMTAFAIFVCAVNGVKA